MTPTRKRLRIDCRGFGLIELLIVMIVLAILAAIAIPSYSFAVRKARRTEGRAALAALMQQQERYYSQHTRYVAFSAELRAGEAGRFKWHSGETPATSAYEISGEACEGQSLRECVQLVAQPGGAGVGIDFHDPECGTFTLASDGRRSASGPGRDCW